MDEESEALARKYVRQLVWSGFFTRDEVVERIEEAVLYDGEADPDWLRGRIEDEQRRKAAEEADWPAVTDCDRLDRAFQSLARQGILALQNAGYTDSDGLEDVTQAYSEAGHERSGVIGYCFYHGQNLERVMETCELSLCYGDILGEDERGVEIGHRVEKALRDAGFAVEWNGSIQSRLLVKGIEWRRRGGR